MAATSMYRSKVGSDSDSTDESNSDTECADWKRATGRGKNADSKTLEKIPIKEEHTVEAPASNKRKRNNIWCEVLEDQMMSETLNHCGIRNKPKHYGERGAESYDYSLKYQDPRRVFRKDTGDKPSDDTEMDVSQEPPIKKFRQKSDGFNFQKGHSDKFVEIDEVGRLAAQKIIDVIQEQKRYLIFRVVKYLGVDHALKLLKETEKIEEEGGMMINNQKRRRTPGGVYLHLVKFNSGASKEVIDEIFSGEHNSFEMKKVYEERRNQRKKLGEAKKSLLEEVEREKQAMMGTGLSATEVKCEENVEEMKDETEESEAVASHKNKPIIDSDAEDGEVD